MILESDPRIGHASSMSSATPAAFLSAMSMTTTSASCLSATPRATVAPTFPAPPTTVTFRFMKPILLRRKLLGQLPRRPESIHTGSVEKSVEKNASYPDVTHHLECFSDLH